MRVVVFPMLLHGGQIHTVSINKSNEFFLTAGLDNKILQWKLEDFTSIGNAHTLEEEKLESIKPLKLFEEHLSLVNNVRWSESDSNSFVSSDIKGNIFLHKCDGISERVFPIEESTPEIRIIDLTWSPDGRLIAWSSSDCKIYIYDTEHRTLQELSLLLKNEKLTVQRSMAFDPTNNFLVTVGEDTLIFMFQYHYSSNGKYIFKLATRITKFVNENSMFHEYKRISWSPDGEYISIPTASKNHTCLISLLSRSSEWNNSVSLVGHDTHCEVVCYNPNVFRADLSEESPELFNIIATAGSDKKLVVWNTTKESPIFVLSDICSKAITDLSWSKNGHELLIVSLEGKILLATFEKDSLGFDISTKLRQKLFEIGKAEIKPFNQNGVVDPSNTSKKSSTNQLILMDQKNAIAVDKLERGDKNVNNDTSTNQKSNVTASCNAPISDSHTLNFGSIESNSTNNGQKNMDILNSAMWSTRNPKSITSKKTSQNSRSDFELSQSKMKVSTKNGKKRIQPLLLSNGSKTTMKSGIRDSGDSSPFDFLKSSKVQLDYEKPSYSVNEDVYKSSTRSKSGDEATSKRFRKDLEPVKFIGSVVVNPNTSFAKMRLAVPKIRLSFQLNSEKNNVASNGYTLEVRNGSGNEATPSRIKYFKNEQQLWCDFIPKYVLLCAQGIDFWALSTSDGQILIYEEKSGRKILPPLVLGSPLSFLEAHSNFLMAVTAIGQLYVWDIKNKRLHIHSPLSLSSLLDLFNKNQDDGLSKAENLTMCSITSKGIPLATLSNGLGYLYNADLASWQLVTEAWWAFGSHYWDSLGNESFKPQSQVLFSEDSGSSIITHLEQKTNETILRKSRSGRGKFFNKISKNMLMKEGFENLENTISLSHLENRILCCEILGEKNDFRNFFITYAKRICELGLKVKLFDICMQLLGPEAESDEKDEPNQWSAEICGIPKHDLLKEIILACAQHRDCQRILLHFSKKINLIHDAL